MIKPEQIQDETQRRAKIARATIKCKLDGRVKRTQKDLAKMLGKTESAISQALSDDAKSINLTMLIAAKEMFGCSIDYLLGYSKAESEKPLAADAFGLSDKAMAVIHGDRPNISEELNVQDEESIGAEERSLLRRVIRQEQPDLQLTTEQFIQSRYFEDLMVSLWHLIEYESPAAQGIEAAEIKRYDAECIMEKVKPVALIDKYAKISTGDMIKHHHQIVRDALRLQLVDQFAKAVDELLEHHAKLDERVQGYTVEQRAEIDSLYRGSLEKIKAARRNRNG